MSACRVHMMTRKEQSKKANIFHECELIDIYDRSGVYGSVIFPLFVVRPRDNHRPSE
jgi:hypothetical protein